MATSPAGAWVGGVWPPIKRRIHHRTGCIPNRYPKQKRVAQDRANVGYFCHGAERLVLPAQLRGHERFIEADELVQKGRAIAIPLKDIESQVRAGSTTATLHRLAANDEALTTPEAALSLACEFGLPGYRAEVQFYLARAEWALARPNRSRQLAAECRGVCPLAKASVNRSER